MKNILLMFLSDVKTKLVGDKVSISEAHYENVDGENTQTTNESAVRYLLKNFPLDKLFIFASQKVRGEISGYRDEDDNPQTHLNFSLARFEKFLPDADYFVFDYDENNSGGENLQSVAEMARHIQKFAAGDKVTLHVDLSGGMRHVNMLILELTRLLEYSGLTVGKVLYSNYDAKTKTGRVEEIQNVYELFQLIAGVEEFVNFGSVKALTGAKGYYRSKKISAPLTKLLHAMENFAAAIKLCHYGQFQEAIENLHDAVNDFNKHTPSDVEDILMARLIGRIHDNYHDLIAIRDKDDLRVIRWCLDNDYLQQALTLYTERIPEYLGAKKFITQSEQEAQNLSKLAGKDTMGRKLWFYLFSGVEPKDDKPTKLASEYYGALKRAWLDIKKKKFDFDAWLRTLNAKAARLNMSVEENPQLRSQLETLAEIFKDASILCTLQATRLDPIRTLINQLSAEMSQVNMGFERRKFLADYMEHASTKDLAQIFAGLNILALLKKYPRAQKMYELFLEENFSVNVPIETFLSIADRYFRIKLERNHSNHAHEGAREFETAAELREFMYDSLAEIENNLPAQ